MVLSAICVFVMQGCRAKQDRQLKCTFAQASESSTICEYLLYLPPEYESGDQRWPLILFLHGAGEVGSQLDVVKKHGPPLRIEQGWRPHLVVVSPQLRSRHWNTAHLLLLLDQVQEDLDIDPDRVYVTGLSLGGVGTWALAAAAPDRFAAAVPICGYGDPNAAERLRDLPIWAFHGANDDVVSVARSQEMVDAVSEIGGDIRMTVYPDKSHDSWTETYASDELYDWLLSHTRKK